MLARAESVTPETIWLGKLRRAHVAMTLPGSLRELKR